MTRLAFAMLLTVISLRAATFSDDFNDNTRDGSKWGTPLRQGNATLQEANGRLDFTVPVAGVDLEHLAGWPWIGSAVPVNVSWEATVTVFNDSQPTSGRDITGGLQLTYAGAVDEALFVEFYAYTERTARRGVLTALDGDEQTFGEVDTLNLGITSAKVRMAFDSTKKVLSTSYQPPSSTQWIPLASWGLAGSGGVTGNRNWNLNTSAGFVLAAGGFSAGDAVPAARVWLDDFQFVLQTTPVGTAPTILTQPPASVSLLVGSNLDLSISASGTTPLSYQWFRGTTALTTGTAAALSVKNVQLTDAGDYYVRVTNSLGSVSSQVTHVEVKAPTAAPTLDILIYPGIRIAGTVGGRYRIEYSNSVSGPTWTLLTTLTLAQSPFVYIDMEAINSQQKRYYRALAVP